MPTDGQRFQKRTPATVSLQVSSAEQPFITELAFTENVSLHGVRVVTERAWKPGERVIVKSYHGTIQSRARVVYCLRLAEARYAVGLELHSAVGKPTKTCFSQHIRPIQPNISGMFWGAIRFPCLDGTNNQIALQGGSLHQGALLLANQLLGIDINTYLGYLEGSKHVCICSEEENIHDYW